MVENISRIQQLLAEAKFVEAQQETEQLLKQNMNSQDYEMILELYFESLSSQNKSHPTEELLKLIQIKINNNSSDVERWINKLTKLDKAKYEYEILLLEIDYFHHRGRLDDLYKTIKDFQNYLYAHRIPSTPEKIKNFILKYFANDFHLKAQSLALDLLRMDLKVAEEKVIDLIQKALLNQNSRESKIKIKLLITVLNSLPLIYQLDIYRNFCLLLTDGIQTKKDIKKIIECIIYFEDFKIQVMLLNLIHSLDLNESAEAYVPVIKKNPRYNFVYIEKYFTEIKYLFIKPRNQKISESQWAPIDLNLEGEVEPLEVLEIEITDKDLQDHEVLLTKLIKIQEFNTETLLDLAVNFIQSDLTKTAIESLKIVLANNPDNKTKLKAYYLLITSYLKIKDYRAALDMSLMAMEIAETQNEILSFLYGQAEAYLKLKEMKVAKKILEKIISIDRNYRLAKEKLEILNAL